MSTKRQRDANTVHQIIATSYIDFRKATLAKERTVADLVVLLRELRSNIVDRLAKAGFQNLAISNEACVQIDAKIALLTSEQPDEVKKAAMTFKKPAGGKAEVQFIPFRKVKTPKKRMRMMKPPESN